jgi:hypothetical protein
LKCRAALVSIWETPYWVKCKEFIACVDRYDFNCRESKAILDAYSAEWFYPGPDDLSFFYLPTFYLENGHAFFIGGRHRTALLSKHLDVLPMAMTTKDPRSGFTVKDGPLDEKSQIAFKSILHRDLALDEILVLPDMPLNSTWREE